MSAFDVVQRSQEEARCMNLPAVDTIVVIEANIDDMTPQNLLMSPSVCSRPARWTFARFPL